MMNRVVALKLSSTLPIVFASAAGLALMDWSTAASACLTPKPPPALKGGPVDGEIDVPTDVVPFYDALAAHIDINNFAAHAAEFVLTSSDGDVIRTSVARSHVWTFELTPERHLTPHTTYTLRGTWSFPVWTGGPTSAEGALVFTTGAGPLGALPPAPVATLQHYQIVNTPLTSCSPLQTGTCFSFAVGLPVDADHFIAGRDGGKFNPFNYLYDGPFFSD